MDSFMKALDQYVDAKVAHAMAMRDFERLTRFADQPGIGVSSERVDAARKVLDDVMTALLRRIST